MKRIILLVCFMACCGCAGAQGWYELGTGPNALNANSSINVICTDSVGNVYAAGQFTDSMPAVFGKGYVAKWDRLTGSWYKLGTGANGLNANLSINTICADRHGYIYAAGDFTDSVRWAWGHRYVAKWDGVTWSELGVGANALHPNNGITSICVDNIGNVYAAGSFSDSAGFPYVAKWSPTTGRWSELGFLRANNVIESICVDDSLNVYASGAFTDPSGTIYVAKWNNNTGTWNELGAGFDSTRYISFEIQSLFTDSPGHVYATLHYEDSLSRSRCNIYKWDGSAWYQLGDLTQANYIPSICAGDSGVLYAAVNFESDTANPYVAKYDPVTESWGALGVLNPHSVNSSRLLLAVCVDKNSHVFTGGDLTGSDSTYCVFAYGPDAPNSISINTIENDMFKLYPNPTANVINIEGNWEKGVMYRYNLYNCLGKTCISGILGGSSLQCRNISLSGLPNGEYFLEIKTDQSFFYKVTKIK